MIRLSDSNANPKAVFVLCKKCKSAEVEKKFCSTPSAIGFIVQKQNRLHNGKSEYPLVVFKESLVFSKKLTIIKQLAVEKRKRKFEAQPRCAHFMDPHDRVTADKGQADFSSWEAYTSDPVKANLYL